MNWVWMDYRRYQRANLLLFTGVHRNTATIHPSLNLSHQPLMERSLQ